MIRLVVVDDQALVRMGLRTLVGAEDDITLVGEAADGREGIAVIRRTVPDVVLMDIRMPVLDGLAALAEVVADPALSAVRAVMLTTFELDEYVFTALRSGASGFILKDADPEEMLRAVRVVAAGGSLLSPTVTRRVIDQFAGPAQAAVMPHPRLATLTEGGDLVIPIAAGVISAGDVRADLYELCRGERPGRTDADQITMFENGGGGHLDLMVARHLWAARRP